MNIETIKGTTVMKRIGIESICELFTLFANAPRIIETESAISVDTNICAPIMT